MPVQLTIRNVPEAVRDKLAKRAVDNGQSMQEFLRVELERLASKPTLAEWLDVVKARKSAAGTELDADDIAAARRGP